jgi:hypothetical protein
MFVEGPTWETTGLGKKITNSLLNKSSSTMVLPPGKKMVLGYCTPIYMLNCIIRVQAVVKIIINETTRALNLLAR